VVSQHRVLFVCNNESILKLRMYDQVYFALGVMIALIYALAIVAIFFLLTPKRPTPPAIPANMSTLSPALGELRRRVENIQQEMQELRKQVWDYGSTEEDRSRRWKIACVAVAGKSVSVLQSCWLGRNEDAVSKAIYDELLTSLISVGLEPIEPKVGDAIDPDGRAYIINKSNGMPPFKVSNVLYPGYYFNPETRGVAGKEDKLLLEPAVIDIVGESISG
jgi:hypothetical protein